MSSNDAIDRCAASSPAPMLDWDVAADEPNIRAGSIELQRLVHRKWFEKIESRPPEGWLKAKPFWRVSCMGKLEILLGRPLSGAVFEAGAGTALCSAMASKRPEVSLVTALDYDRFCVEEMMPLVFEKFEAETDKIERVIGSYNRIPRQAFYDFVIAVGALHHSEGLALSFRTFYDCLKPGGVVLISDVCEPDWVTTGTLAERYEAEDPDAINRYGRPVKIKDNGDHWYRLSEWLAGAWSAGFEALPFLFDHTLGLPADDGIFRAPKPYLGFGTVAYQPYFAMREQYDTLMLVLQKPDAEGCAPIVSAASNWTPAAYAAACAPKPELAPAPPPAKGTLVSRITTLLGR